MTKAQRHRNIQDVIKKAYVLQQEIQGLASGSGLGFGEENLYAMADAQVGLAEDLLRFIQSIYEAEDN
jgi:hypothetical protein